MSLGRNIGYTRWYDRTPEMSQAVRLMERLSETKQRWIAHTIVGLMSLYEVPQRTDGLKKLGTERIIGLLRSKVKRRWYDQDPTVHQAFNYLFLMDEEGRHEMAVKILITIKALEALHLPDQELKTGLRVVKFIFEKPLYYLKQKTRFVVTGQKPSNFLLKVVRRQVQKVSDLSTWEGTPASQPQTTRTNSIDGTQDSGMRIRLKRVSTG